MRRSSRSRCRGWLALGLLFSLSSCSFLADEFGFYDRAPIAERAAGVGVSALADRP